MSERVEFAVTQFKRKTKEALTKVRQVIHNAKHIDFATDVSHVYHDKFALVEYTSTLTLQVLLRVFQEFGLTQAQIDIAKEQAKNGAVTLRFKAENTCEFLRTETKVVDSNTFHQREISNNQNNNRTVITDTVKHKVTTHYWKFGMSYQLTLFHKNQLNEGLVLTSDVTEVEIGTSTKNAPAPTQSVLPNMDLHMNWLFDHVEEKTSRVVIEIDRMHPKCKTPRRNNDVEDAMVFINDVSAWSSKIAEYVSSMIQIQRASEAQTTHKLDFNVVRTVLTSLNLPVLPLFRNPTSEEKKNDKKEEEIVTRTLLQTETEKLLQQLDSDIEEAHGTVNKTFPADAGLVRQNTVWLTFACMLSSAVCARWKQCVEFVEGMLYQQFIAAIGKVVTSNDFAEFMDYYHRKLLRPEYHPVPFSYAVRREGKYPQGTLTIEAVKSGEEGSIPQPISTTVFQNVKQQAQMHFMIDAATSVRLEGQQYLHAWLNTQFEAKLDMKFHISARARQFSSFILVIGKLKSANELDPKHAVIVQNKDDVIVPLLLEQLPTAQEFKDAVESMSPEQQRFCKAFRAMQLEGSVFGLCLIQIKPQLERLLNLPDGSLIKERRLTEQLMQLFVEFQISSDLLSFDGDQQDTSVSDKIERVRFLVERVLGEIEEEKKKELDSEIQKQVYNDPFPIPPAVPSSAMLGFPQPQLLSDNLNFSFASSLAVRSPAPAPPGAFGGQSFSAAPPPMPKMQQRQQQQQQQQPQPPSERQALPVQQNKQDVKKQPQQQQHSSQQEVAVVDGKNAAELDYTTLPVSMDAQILQKDQDGALRTTILKVGDRWRKKYFPSLLSSEKEKTLNGDGQRTEKNKAFDLLDALSRSGDLLVSNTSLHVILPATHCFTKSLIDTVVQDNINPIEKVERSVLIMAGLVHNRSVTDLVHDNQLERLLEYSAVLFDEEETKAIQHKAE